MGADTEMSRLDSLPTEKLNELLNMEGVPKVTSSANGKVLTVVGGKWKAEEPSGGGGATVVDVTYDDDTSVYTSTVKAGALWTAINSGAVIFRTVDDEFGLINIFSLSNANVTEEDGQASEFTFIVSTGFSSLTLSAATADDYPSTGN